MEELILKPNLKTCECGRKFLFTHGNQKQCTVCKIKKKLQHTKKWQKENQNKYKAYQQNYKQEMRNKKAAKQVAMEECAKLHNNCLDCKTPDGECLYE